VCKKNHSEEIWESLLDSSIELYHKYKDSDLPEDEVEIFFFINGEIIENLASNCSIEHTIQLLQNKYTNLNMGGKMTKAFINILSNLSHSINILYLATNLVHINFQRVLENELSQRLHCFNTSSHCRACSYPLVRKAKSTHFRCGHAYHEECVIAREPTVCVACLGDRSDQFSYYLNTLNPQYPKIKKVNDLVAKFEDKKFEMSEVFKVEEFEKVEKREEGMLEALVERKREKFEKFDEINSDVEAGNWRVLAELHF
jgi:hypothetical protein